MSDTRTVRVREAEKRWHTNYYEFEVDASLSDVEAEREARRMVETGEVYPYDSSVGDVCDENDAEIEEVTL